MNKFINTYCTHKEQLCFRVGVHCKLTDQSRVPILPRTSPSRSRTRPRRCRRTVNGIKQNDKKSDSRTALLQLAVHKTYDHKQDSVGHLFLSCSLPQASFCFRSLRLFTAMRRSPRQAIAAPPLPRPSIFENLLIWTMTSQELLHLLSLIRGRATPCTMITCLQSRAISTGWGTGTW